MDKTKNNTPFVVLFKSLLIEYKTQIREKIKVSNYELSDEEFSIFYLIVFNKVNTVSKLNTILVHSQKPNISRCIKNLIEKQYLSEELDKNDRRIRYFSCQNKDLEKTVSNLIEEINQIYLNKISQEEFELLTNILHKLKN